MNKLKIGIIGCGSRTTAHLKALEKTHPDQWVITAVMDPSNENTVELINNYGNNTTRHYSNYKDMLSELTFDGVIVASPNRFHYEHAMAIFKSGIPLLLEKPLATQVDQCKKLLHASKQSTSTVVFGFVLRYTPFYSKIKEILNSGKLGNVMTINATESISARLVSLYSRNWRNSLASTGPFILEKCSHDMDICNWLAGASPVQVSSFANRTYFQSKRQPAAFCPACPEEHTCRYNSRLQPARDGNLDHKDRDLCVYNDFDHPDRQMVSIAYENGVLANFTYAWGQPTDKRTLHIMGTEGELFGDFQKNEIRVHHYKELELVEETIKITDDSIEGHHGGGDYFIADSFYRAMTGEKDHIKAGVKEGVDAALVALAADKSSKSGQIVQL